MGKQMRKEVALSLMLLGFMGGCATPAKMITLIRTEPPGAEVTVGNRVIGKTPITYDLDQALGSNEILSSGENRLPVNFHLEGYEDELRTIQKVKGSFGYMNGRWPNEVEVELEKKR
jgi:hypothetical protein